MNRKFYACSVGEPGKDYVDKNFDRIVDAKAFVLHKDTSQKGSYNEVQNGDILFLKYNNAFVAYGISKGIETSDDEEWNLIVPVEEWVFKNPNNKKTGVHYYGIGDNTISGGQYGTVKGLDVEFALQKMKEINSTSHVYLKILNEYITQKKSKDMQELIDLLKYKKQIVLQGPPGTGKTRLAKEIAYEMMDSNRHHASNEIILSKEQILKLFTIGTKLSTVAGNNNYIVKSNNDDKIALQRENGATDFTTFSKIIEYYKNKKWESDINGNDERRGAALAKYAYDNIEKPGRDSTVEPQINLIQFHPSYTYEDFVRGIVAESKGNQLEYKNVNKLLGKFAEEAKKNWEDSNKDSTKVSKENKVREYFEQFVDELSEKLTSGKVIKLTESVNIIDVEEDAFRYKGADGWTVLGNRMLFKDIIQAFLDGNKVRQDIKKNKNLSGLAIQHASYFVRVLNMFQEFLSVNRLSFENLTNEKIVLKNYVLIIDEINRANLSSVLGELIYALEYRNEAVESMYEVDGSNKLVLPPNLYIIGTMNTADRSVGHIDYAIRRRFAFVDVLPKVLTDVDFKTALFEKVAMLFVKDINGNALEPSEHLSSEFKLKDVWLGHSYFIQQYEKDATGEDILTKPVDFNLRLQYEIVPILEEYIKDGVLKESAKKIIDELKLPNVN